jgi:hypothetical protein
LAKFGDSFGSGTKFGAFKTLIANVPVTSTMAKGALFFKTIIANVRVSTSVIRASTFIKTLIANAIVSGSIRRYISKTITAATSAGASFIKSTYKILTTTVTGAGTFIKAISKTITAHVSVSPVIQKFIAKTLTALAGALACVKRYFQVYPSLSYTTYDIEMEYTSYDMTLEVKGMAIAGSTVTLQGTFPDSAGSLAELESVTCKVYGPGRVLLETLDTTMIETGVYTAQYTIPETKFGQLDYEFSGVLGTKTIVGRSSIDSNWKQ